ncbi:MAG: hypothetical protein JWO97_1844 [Acidobacteria bacterium]|nr:hypothetical protein [Acidobacteriota bacterium]
MSVIAFAVQAFNANLNCQANGPFTVPASINVAGPPFLPAPVPTPAISPARLAMLGVALVIVARIASRSQL